MVTKVRLERVKQDKSQKETAALACITPHYLRMIESGRVTNPSKEVMDKLAAALGTTVQALFYEEEE